MAAINPYRPTPLPQRCLIQKPPAPQNVVDALPWACYYNRPNVVAAALDQYSAASIQWYQEANPLGEAAAPAKALELGFIDALRRGYVEIIRVFLGNPEAVGVTLEPNSSTTVLERACKTVIQDMLNNPKVGRSYYEQEAFLHQVFPSHVFRVLDTLPEFQNWVQTRASLSAFINTNKQTLLTWY